MALEKDLKKEERHRRAKEREVEEDTKEPQPYSTTLQAKSKRIHKVRDPKNPQSEQQAQRSQEWL